MRICFPGDGYAPDWNGKLGRRGVVIEDLVMITEHLLFLHHHVEGKR